MWAAKAFAMIKNMGEVFAGIQVVLAAVAAVGYALARDWKHALYWALAGGITAVVTWGLK